MSLEDNHNIDKGRLEIWKDNIQPINLPNYFMRQESKPHSRETQNRVVNQSFTTQKPVDFMKNR